MKIKFLFLFATLFAGLCGCSDDDKGNGDGPAGSSEMLVGMWGASHMTVEVDGQEQSVDVDASISTFTFYANGTLTEFQDGITTSGTWTYNSSTRKLRLVNPVSDLTAHVRSMTASVLILEITVTEEGVAMRMILTYERRDSRSGGRAASGPVTDLPMLSSVVNRINRN